MNFSKILLLLTFVFLQSLAVAQSKKVPPNIVVIFVDDLGYGDLGVYGHPTIRTPKLDQMAAEGMRFTQFYVAAAVCTPSRAGLLTGRYPVRTGMVHGLMKADVLFPNSDIGLPQQEVTIAEVLKEKNYATMAIGKWHLGHLPQYLPTAQGFDSYYGVPYSNDMDHVRAQDGKPAFWNIPLMQNEKIIERPADQHTLTKRYTEEAVKFIKNNSRKPFFLYLAHSMPHTPIFASAAFEGKSRRGLYGDVVEELDWSAGEIMKTLKDLKLDKNTLVIFTSDNGPWLVQRENGGSAALLREGKGSTWEGGHRVPMIAWWPGKIPAGAVNEDVATALDVLPTAAALANAPLPDKKLDGYNIWPVLIANKQITRDAFMFYRGDQVFAVRDGKWKAHFITQTAYPNGPLEYQKTPLLYDLDTDPSEKYNVAAKHPEIIQKIKELKERHEKTVVTSKNPSVEAEALLDKAATTGGKLQVQEMTGNAGDWSGGSQLLWAGTALGNRLTLPVEVKEAGNYELFGFFTRAKNYGVVQVLVNGKPAGALIDGYADQVEPSGPQLLGNFDLQSGTNKIEFEVMGKDVRSGGTLFGIDGILVRKPYW